MAISKIPLALSIQPIQRLILLKNEIKRSIANADMINGIANPAEYAMSSDVPAPQLELVAAIVKIAANIGPIHGVQPAPKAIPTNKEPIFFVERFWKLIDFCMFSLLSFKIPIRCKPNAIRTIPPILSIHSVASSNIVPAYETAEPRITKIIEKPKTNNNPLVKTIV